MSNQPYSWKRFWYPRESPIDLLDGGYLYRPEKEWAGHLFGSTSLEELLRIPCLILLGEPEMGKSQELKLQATYTEEQLSEKTFQLDLKGYQDQSMLYNDLFEGPIFREWASGTHRLHLFLDNFDEGLLTLPTLPQFL